MNKDNINHPIHYNKYKTEVIQITRYLPFCLGNVVKYVLRAPYKGGVEDCDKALFYWKNCDDTPLYMQVGDAEEFFCNLQNYIDELEADNTPVADIQRGILIELRRFVRGCGTALYLMEGRIKSLRKELCENV